MNPLWAVVLTLGAGTYLIRAAGPLLVRRAVLPDAVRRLLNDAATLLLVGLIAVATLVQGHAAAGWARPCAVLVAGVLAWRRVPFPLVVGSAALVAAGLRGLGVP